LKNICKEASIINLKKLLNYVKMLYDNFDFKKCSDKMQNRYNNVKLII
jgi:hypothetical protein